MELTLLPEEVLEVIVDYLSVKDILASSAVSLGWREKFNNDRFWRKFCIGRIQSCLEDTPCEVEPAFQVPDLAEGRLMTVCTWRLHYMREIHLLNNWKSQKFSSSFIRPYTEVISCDVKNDCEGCHWLFIRTISNVEIWNINTKPQQYAEIPILLNCPNTSLFIIDKRVILTQWNMVTVYDLENCDESLKTMFRFKIEENKVLSSELWDCHSGVETEQINIIDDFRFNIFGSYLVGYKRIPNPKTDLSMHIWDVNSSKKVKVESMLNTLVEFKEIEFTNIFKINDCKGLIRLMFLSSDEELCSQLFIYNFKICSFENLNIMFEGVVAWCGCAHDIVVTFTSHPGTIKFYKRSSGKLLSVKDIGIYTNSEQMQLTDSYLLYCMFNCMNVMDIYKQEVVYCLQFSFYSFVRRLTIIEPRFVVVWLLERGGSPGCPSYHQEVLDLENLSHKLFQFSSELGLEIITSSSSIIKLIVNCSGMINLLTFW